jgi:hypothetical protein
MGRLGWTGLFPAEGEGGVGPSVGSVRGCKLERVSAKLAVRQNSTARRLRTVLPPPVCSAAPLPPKKSSHLSQFIQSGNILSISNATNGMPPACHLRRAGDVTLNPEARCMVMTTEILRSMIYRGSEFLRYAVPLYRCTAVPVPL